MVHKGKKKFLKNIKPTKETEEKNEEEKPELGEGNGHQGTTRKARLIVRNLPFKGLSDDKLKDHFKTYGDIEEIKILKKPDGKFVGCGFVQFHEKKDAAKAMIHLNGKDFLGRPIIVDWALPKDTYLNKIQIIKGEYPKNDSNDVKLVDAFVDTIPDTDTVASNESSQEEDDIEDEDNDDDSLGEDENYSEDEDDEEDKKVIPEKKRPLSNDAEDGKTVFIKNVPFSVTGEELKKVMSKFGEMHYALICVDPMTEHSKGSGFVKFKDKTSADEALQASKVLTIQDQVLEIKKALSKEHLLEQKKPKEKKDGRNLYLVKEGVILAGSKASLGLSKADMAKRLQIEQWKSQMLKNLHMFVARTRIVIHNLPEDYDENKLRDMVKYYSEPGTFIKEARILRDRKRVDSKGIGLSKQVGFVTFGSHEHALAALRKINNNPEIFRKDKRPIVTFSIENREILNLKQKRVERSRAKMGVEVKSKLNRKQRRAVRRKQKKIEQFKLQRQLKRDGKLENVKKINKNENIQIQTKPETINKKRKLKTKTLLPNKKQKVEEETYSGVKAEPGKIMKLRSRYKLDRQMDIHSKTLKKEKVKKKKFLQKKVEKIRQPAQKKHKKVERDSRNLNNIISDYKNKLMQTNSAKKWYED